MKVKFFFYCKKKKKKKGLTPQWHLTTPNVTQVPLPSKPTSCFRLVSCNQSVSACAIANLLLSYRVPCRLLAVRFRGESDEIGTGQERDRVCLDPDPFFVHTTIMRSLFLQARRTVREEQTIRSLSQGCI